MRNVLRIAVIGGGLGGTVAAALLQRAGFNVAVYEQAPSVTRVGAGINIDPHGMRLMRRLGVEQRLIELGCVSELRYSREWDSGEVTFDVPVAHYHERYGGNHFSIHRGDLQETLHALLAPDVLHVGKRVAGLRDEGDSVSLEFEDGSRTVADIVIGADGVNSKVREHLLGAERPKYIGRAAYRMIIPVADLGEVLPGDHTKWWGPNHANVVTYYLNSRRSELYVMASLPEPEWGAADFLPQAADRDRLRAHLAGFHPNVRRYAEAFTTATRWATLERDPLPLWSRGRIVLLGDACHPMANHMGQGAAMAFEDAVILARCLEQSGGSDVRATFALYEALRYERASRVQRESRENTWLRYPMDPGWVFDYDAFEAPLQAKVAA